VSSRSCVTYPLCAARDATIFLALSALPIAAQVAPGDSVAAVHLTGAPFSTQLLIIDQFGTVTPYGRFPSDTMPPLAVAIDPYDRELLVALDLGATSRVVRLLPTGTQLVGEIVIGDLPGRCQQLSVIGDRLLATLDGPSGGIIGLPRRSTGPAAMLFAQPRAAALHRFGPQQSQLVLAWSGDPAVPGADPGIGYVDLETASFYYGPFSYPSPSTAAITGIADLPTGASRQLVAFADGTYTVVMGGSTTTTPMPTNPPVPTGGAASMYSDGGGPAGLAVGGAAFPFLYRIDAFTGTVTLVAGPLPGDPVDYAPAPSMLAQVLTFGEPCGLPAFGLGGSGGAPGLGNQFFQLDASGALAQQALIFVAGFSDVRSFATVLPLPLPGPGCPLEIDPLAVVFALTSPSGTASLPLPIPGAGGFFGTLLFAQALQIDPAGFVTSPALVAQIGN